MSGQRPQRPPKPPTVFSVRDPVRNPNVRLGIPRPVRQPQPQPQQLRPRLFMAPNIQQNPNIFVVGPDPNQNQALQVLQPFRQAPLVAHHAVQLVRQPQPQ